MNQPSPGVGFKLWYLLVSMIVTLVIVAALGWVYTGRVDRENDRANELNDRKWCNLLIVLDDSYKEAPPTSRTGQLVATSIRKLRNDLGC